MCFVNHQHRDGSEILRVFDKVVIGKHLYWRVFQHKEFAREFLSPLASQVGGDDDNDGCVLWLVQKVLANNDPSLNRLPQPNFICEQVPLHRIGQNPPNGCDLVFE